jgi:hypothetical protein
LSLGLLVPCVIAPIALRTLRKNGMRPQASILAIWLVLALLTVFIQGKYWLYHWIPATIALSVTTGIAVDYLVGKFEGYSLLTERAASLLILMAVMATPGLRALFHSYPWPMHAVALESDERFWSRFHTPDGDWQYRDIVELSTYVADHSQESDRVLVWGWDPLINVLSRRSSPTRFGYSYPLTVTSPKQEGYRAIFLGEIERMPPKFIVIDDSQKWSLADKPGLELLREFPEFSRIVASRYTMIGDIGTFQLWKQNE